MNFQSNDREAAPEVTDAIFWQPRGQATVTICWSSGGSLPQHAVHLFWPPVRNLVKETERPVTEISPIHTRLQDRGVGA